MAGPEIGPNLYDIVGARVGRTDGFDYSRGLEALRAAGAIWTVEQLNYFLAGPNTAVPGTLMAHPGIDNSQERINVIAFLRSLSANPVSLVPTPVATMPDWRLPPTFGDVKIVSGTGPAERRVPVQSGGPINAGTALGGRCLGFIAEAPELRMTYRPGSGRSLVLSVDSLIFTVIVVRDPNGDWFCDDNFGSVSDPSIEWKDPAGGEYQIWVGTYADNSIHAATLVAQVGGATLGAPDTGSAEPADDTGRPYPWEEAQFLASYRDWTVFRQSGCFIASLAVSSEPENPALDPTYVIVLDQPAGGDGPRMAFLFGYNLDGRHYATASVDGGRAFNLVSDAGDAFIDVQAEEPALIEAMRQGVELVLSGTTPGGSARRDTISLLGFTAALEHAQTACH